MNRFARLLYLVADRLPASIRFKLLRRWNPTGRSFLRSNLTFETFIEHLNSRRISYAVLDDRPDKQEVLVSDSGSDDLQDLITRWPVGIPIKIYTPSARPGTEYISPLAEQRRRNRIAILPIHLADGILERAELLPNGRKVASACDAFFTRAYRAAYMEGTCCDESKFELLGGGVGEHRCRLKQMASAAGISLPEEFTLGALDEMLQGYGWRPASDLIEKAAEWAPWLRSAFPELQYGKRVEEAGVAAFFMRERAVADGFKDAIIAILKENGLHPLLIVDLDQDQRVIIEREWRGGNWGKGPWSLNGGGPGCIVITYNPLPLEVPAQHQSHRADCDDWKIICAKQAARRMINENLARDRQYNGLHSTDNSDQAWRVVRMVAPHEETAMRAKIEEVRQSKPWLATPVDLTGGYDRPITEVSTAAAG